MRVDGFQGVHESQLAKLNLYPESTMPFSFSGQPIEPLAITETITGCRELSLVYYIVGKCRTHTEFISQAPREGTAIPPCSSALFPFQGERASGLATR